LALVVRRGERMVSARARRGEQQRAARNQESRSHAFLPRARVEYRSSDRRGHVNDAVLSQQARPRIDGERSGSARAGYVATVAPGGPHGSSVGRRGRAASRRGRGSAGPRNGGRAGGKRLIRAVALEPCEMLG